MLNYKYEKFVIIIDIMDLETSSKIHALIQEISPKDSLVDLRFGMMTEENYQNFKKREKSDVFCKDCKGKLLITSWKQYWIGIYTDLANTR